MFPPPIALFPFCNVGKYDATSMDDDASFAGKGLSSSKWLKALN